MSHVRIGRVDRHHVIDVLYGNRERLPASLTLAYQERRRIDDCAAHQRRSHPLRQRVQNYARAPRVVGKRLLRYLVRPDAVFVAGVAAA